MDKKWLTALDVATYYYSEEYANYLAENSLSANEETADTFITEVEEELNNSEIWHN